MLHYPIPLPILLLMAISFLSYLGAHRTKRKRESTIPRSVPKPVPSKIQSVAAAHVDCTAEVFNVCSYTLETNHVTMRHIPGDPVELKMVDDCVAVYVDGVFINKLYPPSGSHLRAVVESGTKYHTYLWARDMEASNPNWMDFLSIIVFYKIDGVPPTKVIIDS